MSWGAVAAVGSAVVGGIASKSAADKQAAASKNAANASLQASREANDLQREMYYNNVNIQKPWLTSGSLAQSALAGALGLNPQFGDSNDTSNGASGQQLTNAAGQYAGQLTKTFSPSDLTTDPSYKWRLEQGQKSLEASAAARGGLLTGQGLKDINDYGQNAASQEYQAAFDRFNTNQNNLYNRLAGVAGAGQNSANTVANLGANSATQQGTNLQTGTNLANNYNIGGAKASGAGDIALGQSLSSILGAGSDLYSNYQKSKIGVNAGDDSNGSNVRNIA